MNNMPAGRVSSVAVGAVAFALAVTGCASSTVQYGSAAIGPAAVAKPLNAYLLTQSDVPVGFEQQTLPTNIPQRADSLLQGIAGSTVTPSSCTPPVPPDATSELQDVRTAAFVDLARGGVISSAVNGSSKRATVESYRRYNLGRCSSISVSGTISGRDFSSTIASSKLDVHVRGVPRALALRQSVTTQTGGRTRTTAQLVGVLPVPNATVLVTFGTVGGSSPDQAQFRTVLAAVGKKVTSSR
ncbi:hypothetical protein ACXVUM_13315 [Williamsia sp. SKLECPSW1]